jgi:DNA-binding transcriptional LysR family regulator
LAGGTFAELSNASIEDRERERIKRRDQLSPNEKNVNTLLNIRAFLLVARSGSFSAAARDLAVAPSVITKRISQLEEEMGAHLFVRSTRGLSLTSAGERLLPRYLSLVAELDEIITGAAGESGIQGNLRIKSPTTVTSAYLGALFSEFHARHPGLDLEIVLMDRSVNPLEEGFDMVIGARPATYPNVEDIPLGVYRLVLCGSPEYLHSRSAPRQPAELVEHRCLTSVLLGNTWLFESSGGTISVEVHSKFHANDGRVLLEAVRRGLGFATLPAYLAAADLRAGTLVRVLEDFPLVPFWLKALVPRVRMNKPAVRELVAFLRDRMQPLPPWEAEI